MMEPAVLAKQVIRCITDQANWDHLPVWVQESLLESKMFMTSQDSYTGLWVMVPGVYETEGLEVELAVRAIGSDIIINRGSGQIAILCELAKK